MLRFVPHALHELLEALIAADIGEIGIIFIEEGVIDEAAVNCIFQPI